MAGRESSGNAFRGQGATCAASKGGRSAKQIPHHRSAKAANRVRDDKRRAEGVKGVRGIRPVSPKEKRKLERAVGKKNEKLRSKYRAVHGKVVDWVDHAIEDGNLFVSIRFQDKTDFSLQFSAKIVADEIDLCEVRGGNFRLVRQYYRRQEE